MSYAICHSVTVTFWAADRFIQALKEGLDDRSDLDSSSRGRRVCVCVCVCVCVWVGGWVGGK
jgi:hypothetical protein